MTSTGKRGLFFGRLGQAESLSREQEANLIRRWQTHRDRRAAERLVQCHLRYVVSAAKKYQRYGVCLEELVAEGSYGLVYSLDKFDPDKGTRLVTYASYWIRARILGHILRFWSVVGTGGGALRSRTFFRLRRERARIANLVADHAQARAELARTMGVDEDELGRLLQRLDARDVSTEIPLFDGDGQTLGDQLRDPRCDQESEFSTHEATAQMSRRVQAAMETLDQREQFIVERRMLADREDELSLAEIGRQLGVSRERARQLETRAKGKLRDLLLSSLPLSGAFGDELRFA